MYKIILHVMLLCISSYAAAQTAAQDPPSRVGRLSYLEGAVSFKSTDSNAWVAAVKNHPVTQNNRIWTDDKSRAEIHFGTFVLRMAPHSSLMITQLHDGLLQINLAEGHFDLRIRQLNNKELIEADLPNSAVKLQQAGLYHIDVTSNGQKNTVVVRQGQVEIFHAGEATTVDAVHAMHIDGNEHSQANISTADAEDAFEQWCRKRDAREDNPTSLQYVSRNMVGYEELDDNNGHWQTTPEYGSIWVPTVAATWVPYRYGHWAYVSPWGWTWVDDAEWGFAPFHYGRWVYWGSSWVWAPGAYIATPVYAPALVAFVGIGVGVGIGWGAPVAWFPLGYCEAYVPHYYASYNYVHNVNVSQTNVSNITNVQSNHTYANQHITGAVTSMPTGSFQSGQPVAAKHVTLTPQALKSAHVLGSAPHVQPPFAAKASSSTSAPHPPAAIENLHTTATQHATQWHASTPAVINAVRPSIAPHIAPTSVHNSARNPEIISAGGHHPAETPVPTHNAQAPAPAKHQTPAPPTSHPMPAPRMGGGGHFGGGSRHH